MTKRSNFLTCCAHLLADRGGNFAMMAAIVAPVLIACGGVTMDMANMTLAKSQLQAATDSAALAASSALANEGITLAQAKLTAKEYLKAHMRNSSSLNTDEMLTWDKAMDSNTDVEATEEKSSAGNAKTYVVKVTAKLDLPLNAFTRLLGQTSAEIGAASQSSSSTEAKNALSMFLVLDQSGSMSELTKTLDADSPTKLVDQNCRVWNGWKYVTKTCQVEVANYLSKIESLKLATSDLLTHLQTADPDKSLVRTGVASYSSKLMGSLKLDWGVTKVLDYVNALPAEGGTDSSEAIDTAYKALSAASEISSHVNKNGQQPKKFIVFMTDGENNYYNNRSNDTGSDIATKKTCDNARKAGMEVYTVAFMAPDRGQNLLRYCATTAGHYFPAENATELTAAFKYIAEKASEMSVRLTR